MKSIQKWLALLLAGALLTSLSACNSGNDSDSNNTDTTTTDKQAEQTEQVSDKGYSPETLYEALLTADDAIVTVTTGLESDAPIDSAPNGLHVDNVTTYTLSGPLVKCENASTEALVEPVYYDFENGKQYTKMIADETWTVSDFDDVDRTILVQDVILLGMPEFFEDDDYELSDGKYVFTQKAINALIDYLESTFEIDAITLIVGEQFEIEVAFEMTDNGGDLSYVITGDAGSMTTKISIRFVETKVTLPEVTE